METFIYIVNALQCRKLAPIIKIDFVYLISRETMKKIFANFYESIRIQ